MAIKKLFTGRIESSVVLGAILVVLFFSIGTNGLWLNNLPSVLALTAQVGIVAIGQALLMTSGEVDLSVGSVFAIVGIVFITLMDWGVGVIPSMLLAVVVASMIGLINGLITVKFKVPSMIVTLGAMFVFRGLAFILTTGFSLSIPRANRDDALIGLIDDRTLGISHAVVILVLLTAFFVFLLGRTRLGNHIFAVGGDPDSALANGVSPDRVKTIAFVLCSMLTGIAGVVVVCQEGAVYSTSGRLMELETIAAAVIGGCTLRGGVGSIWGPVLGVFVLSSLKGGLILMGAPTYWYKAFVGMILIGFLIASMLLSNRYGQST